MYGYGNSMFLATHGILARGGTPPANTVAPVISGSTSLGSVLTSTTGTWTGDAPITYSYQWKRNGIDIGGATSSTYTIVVADSAANLTCQVTATNAAGFASAVSNTITAQTFTAPVNTVAPTITGTAQEGQTLTCSTGTWTGNPTPTYAYQWKRNNVNIGSATNSTYLLVSADVGQSIKCTVTATNGVGSVNADSNTVTPTAAVDPDAQAFITAAAITNPTQQSAINQLVVDLKGYNIWTKMKGIWPIVGGSASAHAVNLKTPGTFNLTFASGWTHGSTGMTPNGATYANTSLPTTGNITQNSGSMGVYSRTNTATTGAHGIRPSSLVGLFELFERWTDNNFYCYLNDSGGFFGTSILDSRGFNQGSRTALNAIRYNRNTNTNTGITASNGTSTLTAYIGASNANNTATFYNNREIAFFYIGDGLTNTEMQNYYTAVQAYQTTLGRQV